MTRLIENKVENRFLVRFLLTTGLVKAPEEAKLLPSGEIEPRFIAPTDGHFFDINTNSTEEVAKVVLEEMVTRDKTKRVTNSEPVKTKNGVPQIEFSDYNVHARAEFKATQRSFQLAKDCDLIFWISAEDGGAVYKDGRFNIYFKTVEEGEIVLKGKHLPLDIDRFESFKLGQKLVKNGGITVGEIETVEDLRVQPIGFKLENQEEWLSECRRMMPEFEEFWSLFENGKDLKQEEEMLMIVERAKKFANGNNVKFQIELERQGIKINEIGNHGSGYLGGVLDFKIEKRGGEYYTEPVVDNNGNLICPVCGAKVSSSDSKCFLCGIGLKEKND